MIVADSSVIVDFLLAGNSNPALNTLIATSELCAPDVLDYEVVNTLRKHVLSKKLTIERARAALDAFDLLDIMRFGINPFVSRIWALRNNMTAYDASYVVLAETLDCELYTGDKKLSNAAGHSARIVLLATAP